MTVNKGTVAISKKVFNVLCGNAVHDEGGEGDKGTCMMSTEAFRKVSGRKAGSVLTEQGVKSGTCSEQRARSRTPTPRAVVSGRVIAATSEQKAKQKKVETENSSQRVPVIGASSISGQHQDITFIPLEASLGGRIKIP